MQLHPFTLAKIIINIEFVDKVSILFYNYFVMLKSIRHFFGIYTKEEKEQQAIEEKQARAERERKQKIIEQEVSIVEKRAEEQSLQDYIEGSDRMIMLNSECPKCWSKQIVDKITRLQWKWEIDWYFRSGFFSGSWSIDGEFEMDTNEINNCNDCWNQRKKHTLYYDTEEEIIEDMMYKIRWINEWDDLRLDDKGISFLRNNNISRNAILKLSIKYDNDRFLWGNNKLCFRQL